MFGFGSEPKPTPEEFKQSRYLLMDPPTLLPAGSGDAYAKEFQEIRTVTNRGGAVPLAVVAATAIDGLYGQIAHAKRRRKR